jgi:hypothetical protein
MNWEKEWIHFHTKIKLYRKNLSFKDHAQLHILRKDDFKHELMTKIYKTETKGYQKLIQTRKKKYLNKSFYLKNRKKPGEKLSRKLFKLTKALKSLMFRKNHTFYFRKIVKNKILKLPKAYESS